MYLHNNYPVAAIRESVLGSLQTEQVLYAAELISQADGLIIAAGAGMGIDSGLPDLGDNHGLWHAYPALEQLGLGFSDVASPQMFRNDPHLAWGFYGHRLGLYRQARPHAGHAILQRWSQATPLGSFVYTSNIDEQFQRAGFAAERIHECHGSLQWLQCLQPCCNAVWPATSLQPRVNVAKCHWRDPLPHCPHCGGLARPNVLMFRDGDWQDERYDRQFDRMAEWLRQVRRPVVIEIGAGTEIATVRHLSQHLVQQFNARLVRINPNDEAVSRETDVGLAAGALAALQAIDHLINGA